MSKPTDEQVTAFDAVLERHLSGDLTPATMAEREAILPYADLWEQKEAWAKCAIGQNERARKAEARCAELIEKIAQWVDSLSWQGTYKYKGRLIVTAGTRTMPMADAIRERFGGDGEDGGEVG